MEYLIVVEKGRFSYGAFVPDLPGCVSAGGRRREVVKPIRESVRLLGQKYLFLSKPGVSLNYHDWCSSRIHALSRIDPEYLRRLEKGG
jgi:hypothetical protein